MPNDEKLLKDYLNGDSQNTEIISAVLAENEPAFDLIKRGVQCHRCIGPEVISFDSNVSYLRSFRQLGALLAAKARACLLAGRYSDAVNSCAIVIKFGSLIQNDSESLCHFMIANSILSRGFDQVQDIARDENVPLEELNRLSSELAKIGPADPGFVRTVKGEYQITSNVIKQMKEGKFDIIDGLKDADNKRTSTLMKRKWILSVLFQQNKTKILFAKLFRNAIADAPLPYSGIKRWDFRKTSVLQKSRLEIIFQPNSIGILLYIAIAPSVDEILNKKCEIESMLAANKLIVACNQYRKAKGNFPPNLQSLKPDFLPEIPLDPYDGKEFRYSPLKTNSLRNLEGPPRFRW